MFRVSMLLGTIALLLLAACIQVAPTLAPTGTPITRITREQAIQIALRETGSQPEVTAVENPRNPVARLMTLGEYQARFNLSSGPWDAATLVWVVQYEGVSYSAGFPDAHGIYGPRTQYNYTTVVMDAQSGTVIMGSRTFAPLFPT